MADSPQRTDDDLNAEVAATVTATIERRARRLAAQRSEAAERVLTTAKAWRAAREKVVPTGVYLDAVRAHVAAVDALDEVNAKGSTGEQG